MHDDLFTKHILDYLRRIIYNRRENVSSKNFSFRMWNTQYHTSFSEKSYLRYCYKWTYHRTICLKKGQQKVFGQFLPKFFNKNPKNKEPILQNSRGIFLQSEMQKRKINQHKNICTTSYDRIIDSMFYCWIV